MCATSSYVNSIVAFILVFLFVVWLRSLIAPSPLGGPVSADIILRYYHRQVCGFLLNRRFPFPLSSLFSHRPFIYFLQF